MPSQFFGLTIGSSGLSAFQNSLNTTANNIANVKTVGYTRQTTVLESRDPMRVYARYGSTGTGVDATAVIQERNLYYDTKYWQNSSNQGFYEQRYYYLDQIQTILRDDENSQKGFTTIFASMFADLDTLKTQGEVKEVRNQFIHEAQSLCTYFNQLSINLSEMQKDCNEEIQSTVSHINSISEKIGVLNKQINEFEMLGGHANELRDQRANLIDELSGIVNVETREYPVHNSHGQDLGGTNYIVYVNGHILVDGNDYRTLECQSSEYRYNQSDIDGLYSIVWSDTGMDFPATGAYAGGTLKGLFDVRDGNDHESLKGVVDSAQTSGGNSSITIKNVNQKDFNSLMIPQKGRIMINSKYYYYDSWEAKIDADGISTVKFNLSSPISNTEATALTNGGSSVVCGENVDAMGIPYYQSQITEFLRNFTQAFNDIEKTGVDLDGKPMGAFFNGSNLTDIDHPFDGSTWDAKVSAGYPFTITSSDNTYYGVTGASVQVNSKSIHDPSYFSTATEINNGKAKYDVAEKLMDLQKTKKLFRGDGAESFLETLLSDITLDVNKNDKNAKTYQNLGKVISQQRTSVSGVDEDEEALDMIKFQNAYNLSSKVISVMNEIYNKLINETGVT